MVEEQPEEMTIEDMFVQVFNQLNEMKKEFGKAIEADRSQINKITESMNQITAAVNARNTALASDPDSNPSSKRGLKLGAGAQGFISMATELGKAFLANPAKFLGTPTSPSESIVKANSKLYSKMIKNNLENSMKLSDLNVLKLEKEIERMGRRGWDV